MGAEDREIEQSATEAVLRVKSSSNAGSLASAIAYAVYDGKKVSLRAIGAGAVNQAVKSVAIAQGFVGPRGYVLSMRPGFTTVVMPDREVSAIILSVFSA